MDMADGQTQAAASRNASSAPIDPALLRGLTRAPPHPPQTPARRRLGRWRACDERFPLGLRNQGHGGDGQCAELRLDRVVVTPEAARGTRLRQLAPVHRHRPRQAPVARAFTAKTGIKVNYFEVIQDNAPFYAQIAPTLRAGKSIGYDIIVMTNNDWTTIELFRINRWATPLEHGLIPNFFINATSLARNPTVDPGNEFTIPWQSGFTGIAYDPTRIKREINSYHDLWDPAFKGHVGMMSDNTELGSAGLLAIGVDPETSTQADWKKAAALLQKQRDAGIVRQYYDQSYIKALESGDIWITQAWSGDIFQANNSGYPHLKFVVPKEGMMVWTDVMMIPLHAQNPVDAMAWMNFYYKPRIGAMVADWVNYVTPVGNTQPILQKSDPTVGNSPLVFPTKAMQAQARQYYAYKDYDDFNAWNNVFNPIIQS